MTSVKREMLGRLQASCTCTSLACGEVLAAAKLSAARHDVLGASSYTRSRRRCCSKFVHKADAQTHLIVEGWKEQEKVMEKTMKKIMKLKLIDSSVT